jgi:hypothetical protein
MVLRRESRRAQPTPATMDPRDPHFASPLERTAQIRESFEMVQVYVMNLLWFAARVDHTHSMRIAALLYFREALFRGRHDPNLHTLDSAYTHLLRRQRLDLRTLDVLRRLFVDGDDGSGTVGQQYSLGHLICIPIPDVSDDHQARAVRNAGTQDHRK